MLPRNKEVEAAVANERRLKSSRSLSSSYLIFLLHYICIFTITSTFTIIKKEISSGLDSRLTSYESTFNVTILYVRSRDQEMFETCLAKGSRVDSKSLKDNNPVGYGEVQD